MAAKTWPFQLYHRQEAGYVSIDTLNGGCGIGNIYDFETNEYGGVDLVEELSPITYKWGQGCGGTGYVNASFIDNATCNQVYRDIKKHHKIVYQSEVRTNANSGNEFFFVIFDIRKD